MRCIFILWLIPSLSFALEYKQKLSTAERQSLWVKSCQNSLYDAQQQFGSKIKFQTRRDRAAFLVETCDKMYAQNKDKINTTTLAPEIDACAYVADRQDLIPGFGSEGNGITFAVGYCQRM